MRVVISMLGLGEIGVQVLRYLQREKERIEKENSIEIVPGGILVRDTGKKRAVDVSGFVLSDDSMEVLQGADIVFECMGGSGTKDTRNLVLYAIRHGKTVIMSSKKCLAMYGREITEAAVKNRVSLYYDATVGGGIPISTILQNMGKCETIMKIHGICNATSNFVLSGMTDWCLSYEESLKEAQRLGYAENNPEEDVDGYDALYKAVILAGFGMKYWTDCREIMPHSIREIGEKDIEEAKKENQVIKPVFQVEKRGEQVFFEVGPKTVRRESILSAVKGCNNIIIIEGSESGERMFMGQGAGAKPTASAMFDDFMKAMENRIPFSD